MFKYIFLAIVGAAIYLVFFFDMQLTNETIGQIFVGAIGAAFCVFLIFKVGLHYRINTLNGFATAFYYSVFEYKKIQTDPSDLNFDESVREQAEVALAANFDPSLSTSELKIPVSMYSGKDPYLQKLRAKIQEAEKLKLKARHLDHQADVLLEKTQEDMVEKNLVSGEKPKLMDRVFDMVNGVSTIINLTTAELKGHNYNFAPDYEIITRIAFDRNPHFANTYKIFDSEDLSGVISRAPFMVILMGIIGTFAGFYLALNQGGDIKAGAAVAIISSLVGLSTSLLMEYINTLYPDQNRYEKAFHTYKVALEILFLHEKELAGIRKGRRKDDTPPEDEAPEIKRTPRRQKKSPRARKVAQPAAMAEVAESEVADSEVAEPATEAAEAEAAEAVAEIKEEPQVQEEVQAAEEAQVEEEASEHIDVSGSEKSRAASDDISDDTEVSAELARALSDLGIEDDTDFRQASSK